MYMNICKQKKGKTGNNNNPICKKYYKLAACSTYCKKGIFAIKLFSFASPRENNPKENRFYITVNQTNKILNIPTF